MDNVSILDPSNSNRKWRQPTSSHFSKRTKIFHPCSNWDNLPLELVLCIFKHLTLNDCARASMVCQAWNEAFHQPDLWRSFEFTLSQSRRSHMQPTPRGLIEYVLKNHRQSLQFVVLKIDSSRESAESACQILSQLVNCSLKTLGLISSAKPSFKQIDAETFVSALTVVFDSSRSLSSVAIDDTPVDDPSLQLLLSNNSNTLELLKMKSCPKVSPEGILALADNCRCLRELSLNYSLLSDELLLSLSSEAHVRLEHLRIDVCSDEDLLFQKISARSWQTLTSHSPKLILVMYFFYIREEIFDQFFQTEIPVTHLYFVDYVPKLVLERIGKHCPRLTELVVGANGNAQIDSEMLLIAHNCRQLTSLGLGECEVSCSAFVEFTRICGPRLKDLSVMEEALTEDEQYDLNGACTEVSRYIGREWMPEVMPIWFTKFAHNSRNLPELSGPLKMYYACLLYYKLCGSLSPWPKLAAIKAQVFRDNQMQMNFL